MSSRGIAIVAECRVCLLLQGLIFAVATNNGLIRLYDSKNYQAGPFSTFLVCLSTPTLSYISTIAAHAYLFPTRRQVTCMGFALIEMQAWLCKTKGAMSALPAQPLTVPDIAAADRPGAEQSCIHIQRHLLQ